MLNARLLAEVKKQLNKGAKNSLKHKSDDEEGEDGYAGSSSILDSMGNQLAMLPKPIIKRVNALKNIQLKLVNIETKFYEELHLLECKYAQIYEPLFDERVKIINGEYEPTEEESKWEYIDIFTRADDLKDSDMNKAIDESNNTNEVNKLKGIPGFWLEAFKNAEIIGDTIQEYDEPILAYLKDVRVKMNNKKPYGFALEFYFNENEYFTNKVLIKSYELTTDLNKEDKDPLGYDGPVVYKCQGTKIDWINGKNPTVKLIKKKQKHKGTGTTRMVTKEEKQESFFNFFVTPTSDGIVPSYKHLIKNDTEVLTKNMDDEEDDDNEFDDDLERLYEEDFEIGRFLKEFMIPKSVLYFTGELVDEGSYEDEDDDDDDDEDEEDDDNDDDSGDGKENNKDEDNNKDDEDDDDEDNSDEENMKKGKKKLTGKLKAVRAGKGKSGEPTPNECKQN